LDLLDQEIVSGNGISRAMSFLLAWLLNCKWNYQNLLVELLHSDAL